MKIKFFSLFFILSILFITISCSTDSHNIESESSSIQNSISIYTYNSSEEETMALINSYRVGIGLNALEKNSYISIKSEEHDNYMINNNVVNHDNFVSRSENIIKVLGAKNVSENIAYNFNTPQSALEAWLKSPGHKEIIEGDYTNFGISIRVNPDGRKYYTNIFIKK